MVREASSEVLSEQVQYYRARACEYDDNFFRRGRYDRGPDATATWFRELEDVSAALDRQPIDGADVLELAAGTGIWTERLVKRARAVMALDAAPEMIGQCRARLGDLSRRVEFVSADIFSWKPAREFDGVMFCFWVSHVPRSRLRPFFSTVAEALRPGGWLFFVDNLRDATHSARDHSLPDPDHEVAVRRVDDGRDFRIVKNYWEPQELERVCREAGLIVKLHRTPTYFQFGTGVLASASAAPEDA